MSRLGEGDGLDFFLGEAHDELVFFVVASGSEQGGAAGFESPQVGGGKGSIW